jgi:ABC-type glycerol-3-phosphate transport system substrate-binding protein
MSTVYQGANVRLSNEFKINCLKAVAAFLSITALIVVAAKDGGSTASSLKIGFVALGIALTVAIVCIPLIAASATFDQFMIRNGAVDIKWYAFASDPPGLAALKAQIKANAPIEKP